MGARWWFQPLLKNISQNGSFPQVGVKIKNTWNQYLGSLDHIWPPVPWASLTATACLMSSGVEASAKKALRDSAWRHFFFLEDFFVGKKVGNKTRKLFGRPKNNRRIQKSALEKEREKGQIDITLSFVYSCHTYILTIIWWTFIRSEKMIYIFFPVLVHGLINQCFLWSSGSPSNVAPWCFQGIWRREWSNGPKLYDKIPAKAIAGFSGGSYLRVKGANLYTKKAETLQP